MSSSEKILNDTFHLVIFSNSPGEISSWVLPIVKTFKKNQAYSFITVLLTPCDYSTGNEFSLLNDNKHIDQVFSPKDTMDFVLFKKKFETLYSRGAILYLGGDSLYPQLFSLRLPYSVYGYTEHKKKLGFLYKKTFFKHIDGDLMSSAISHKTFVKSNILKKYKLTNKEYCLFMPGSRPKHFHLFIPLICDTVKLIKQENPNFNVIISVSPFITQHDLDQVQLKYDFTDIHLIKGDSLELMKLSKLMISLPGTNTAQAMYMNLPLLMVLPLNNTEQFVFDGLAQLLFKLPLIGPFLRYILIKILLIKKPLLALPNIMAKKEIVPEVISYFTPSHFKNVILNLYYDEKKLQLIKNNYKQFNIIAQIDQKICSYLIDH